LSVHVLDPRRERSTRPAGRQYNAIMPPSFHTVVTASAFCYLLGYAVGVAAFVAMAAHRRLLTTGMLRVLSAGLTGGLLCAVLAQFLFTHTEGKSILGGVAGGYITVVLFKRRIGLRRSTGDLFAVALSAGEAVGRWGCYFAGCCYGRATTVPWAIYQHDAWRHPTQIYSSAAAAAILGVLLLVERRRPPENLLFFLQGTLFCIARFVIEAFREGPVLAIGLTSAQVGCAVGIVYFGTGLARLGAARLRSSAVAIA
jgi:phosphatidylglycerol:prolipoprotein diacylglycerol transferase